MPPYGRKEEVKTLDITILDGDEITLIRRYQHGAWGMPIRPIPNFRVSLETKVMDYVCSFTHILARSAAASQRGQRFCERMVTIGFFVLWKRWVQKWRLSFGSIENQFGYLSEKAICKRIGANSNHGIERTRQCMTS